MKCAATGGSNDKYNGMTVLSSTNLSRGLRNNSWTCEGLTGAAGHPFPETGPSLEMGVPTHAQPAQSALQRGAIQDDHIHRRRVFRPKETKGHHLTGPSRRRSVAARFWLALGDSEVAAFGPKILWKTLAAPQQSDAAGPTCGCNAPAWRVAP